MKYRSLYTRILSAVLICLMIVAHGVSAVSQKSHSLQNTYSLLSSGELVSNIPERRLALIIANSDYSSGPLYQLPSAVPDALSLVSVMQELGFEMFHGSVQQNLTREQMIAVINEFTNNLRDGDVVFFYFAGHGIQAGLDNYLMPVDAEVSKQDDAMNEGLSLEGSVLDRMEDYKARANIVVLDACRRNQLNGGVKGLHKPGKAPNNTFIAYAASPGNLALEPSSYTKSIISDIREPGLRIDDLFARVRANVHKETMVQKPATFGTIDPPFFFREPAYVVAHIINADDDAKVIINDKEVKSFTNQGSPENLYLKSGRNTLEIKVYNQRSFKGGIPQLGGRQPEGWSYAVKFSAKDGSELAYLSGREDLPEKDGPRHGKSFTVVTAIINVDRITGKITISDLKTSP
jgi:hypothetical protein